MTIKILIIIALCSIQNLSAAKILGVFPIPSKSHHILASALLKELAKRGHEVTMISPYPLATSLKNYRDIDATDVLKITGAKLTEKLISNQKPSIFQKYSLIRNIIIESIDILFSNNNTLNLINSGETFDVAILSWVWSESLLGLAHKFKAIPIAMCPIGPTIISNSVMGNPSPYSYIPNQFIGYSTNMNFWQRVTNTVINFFEEIFHYNVIYAEEEITLKRYFPNAPPLNELIDNISIVFVNSHPSIQSPQPLVPGIIDIGGLHISTAKLPENIKNFLDNANEGALLFSLGSNVKSADLPKSKLEEIITALHKLPMKVLWKYESNDIKTEPSKVLISKWLPQSGILAHKNVKAFVTHGGLLSITESIYYGIPIVGIPFFGDQEANIDGAVSKRFGVKLLLNTLTEETFTSAVLEVLENKWYRENAQEGSRIFRDQPVKPMDKAIYWVEYVLRHRGARHLKSSILHLKWYQYFLLDVLTLLIVCTVILLTIIYFFLQFIKKSYSKNSNKFKSKKETSIKKKKN